jgi:hypothetical protein
MGRDELGGQFAGGTGVQFGPTTRLFVASAVMSITAPASVQVVEASATVVPTALPSARSRSACRPSEGATNIVWGTSSETEDINQGSFEDDEPGWPTRRDDDHGEWGPSLTSPAL